MRTDINRSKISLKNNFLKKVHFINNNKDEREHLGNKEAINIVVIPGNRYFRLEGERGIFQQLLPLEVRGYE